MTVYALDLDQVHHTIRHTLVERVLPAIESDAARAELLAVIEMLDSLESRLDWSGSRLSDTVSRSRALAERLGEDVGASSYGAADDLEALRASRRAIGESFAAAYANGFDPSVAAAVAEFTTEDVRSEISKGLLGGLPD